MFGGEPTLAFSNYIDYLDRILDICKFYKKRFSGVMISNAYLLDDEMFRELYKRNITQYQITVDGSPETMMNVVFWQMVQEHSTRYTIIY